jgi:hypothetical protein
VTLTITTGRGTSAFHKALFDGFCCRVSGRGSNGRIFNASREKEKVTTAKELAHRVWNITQSEAHYRKRMDMLNAIENVLKDALGESIAAQNKWHKEGYADGMAQAFKDAALIAQEEWHKHPFPALKYPNENAELTALRIRDAIKRFARL